MARPIRVMPPEVMARGRWSMRGAMTWCRPLSVACPRRDAGAVERAASIKLQILRFCPKNRTALALRGGWRW